MSEDVSVEATPEVAEEIVEIPETSDVVETASEVSDAVEANPEAAEAIADAVESGEITEEQAVEMIKQLTIKVDGEEIVKELPFEVDPNNVEMIEFLKKELQLSTMGNKRAQEAAELKKEQSKKDADLQAFIDRLGDKSQLTDILAHFGHDILDVAADEYTRRQELEEMDPRDRQILELQEKIRLEEEAKAVAEKARKDAEFKAAQDRYAAKFEGELLGALEAGDIPNDPFVIQKMASYMNQAIEAGIKVSFSEIMPYIKDEHTSHLKNMLGGASAEQILELLSEEQLKNIILKKTPEPKKEAPPTVESIKETGVKPVKKPHAKKRTGNAEDFFRKIQLGI